MVLLPYGTLIIFSSLSFSKLLDLLRMLENPLFLVQFFLIVYTILRLKYFVCFGFRIIYNVVFHIYTHTHTHVCILYVCVYIPIYMYGCIFYEVVKLWSSPECKIVYEFGGLGCIFFRR